MKKLDIVPYSNRWFDMNLTHENHSNPFKQGSLQFTETRELLFVLMTRKILNFHCKKAKNLYYRV
jgi:hypothetical protein